MRLVMSAHVSSDAHRHTLFEEEPDLIAAFEEVLVADMSTVLACRETSHWVIIERELVQHPIRLSQELPDLLLR